VLCPDVPLLFFLLVMLHADYAPLSLASNVNALVCGQVAELEAGCSAQSFADLSLLLWLRGHRPLAAKCTFPIHQPATFGKATYRCISYFFRCLHQYSNCSLSEPLEYLSVVNAKTKH
jgi:hypothetical protein